MVGLHNSYDRQIIYSHKKHLMFLLLRRQPLDPEKQREGKADGDGSAMVE
jgi:hypothetical protein